MPHTNFIRLVQISDTHLYQDASQALLGVKPNQSFVSVLEALKKDKDEPDLILHSGDMSQDETHESYRYFAEAIQTFKLPTYFIPGNHDNFNLQNEILPKFAISTQKQIILPGWQVILLNSQILGEIPGKISPKEFEFLHACLTSHPNHHTIVVCHHNPIGGENSQSNAHMLLNAQALWDTLKNYPTVKLVLSGHIHQDFHRTKFGIPYYSCPSTWVQFSEDPTDFTLDFLPQGYRWINLFVDGTFETGVIRVPNYIGDFVKYPDVY